MKPLAATLTACVCLFLLAFATAASGRQAEARGKRRAVKYPQFIAGIFLTSEQTAEREAQHERDLAEIRASEASDSHAEETA
jgi:hypothetical protein